MQSMSPDTRPSNVQFLGKSRFPVVLGTAAYGAMTEQDPTTKLFPPRRTGIPKEIALGKEALAMGFNVIDTAEAYGISQKVVAQIINGRPRDEITIVTKVGITPPGSSTAVYDAISASIQDNNQSLGTVPDVTLVHNRWEDRMGRDMKSCLTALVDAEKDGYTGSIGISNFRSDEFAQAIDFVDHIGGELTVYQAKVNLENPRGDAGEIWDICHANGISYMASAALNRGIPGGEEARRTVAEIAQNYDGMTPAQVEVFAVHAWGALPLVQTHKIEHMRENREALSFPVEPEDIGRLMQFLPRHKNLNLDA